MVLIVSRSYLPVLILNHIDDLLLVLDKFVNFLNPIIIMKVAIRVAEGPGRVAHHRFLFINTDTASGRSWCQFKVTRFEQILCLIASKEHPLGMGHVFMFC